MKWSDDYILGRLKETMKAVNTGTQFLTESIMSWQ